MIDLLAGFLSWWTVQIVVLVLFAGTACWLLKNKPGSIHAAVWTTALVLIWVIPIAPYFIPTYSLLPKKEPVVIGAKTRNFPPEQNVNSKQIFSPKIPDSIKPIVKNSSQDLLQETVTGVPAVNLAEVKPVKYGSIRIKDLLVAVWVLGISLSLLRWIRSMKQVQGILANSLPLEEPSTLALIERTRQIFFIHETIEIRTAPVDFAPFLLRLRKPLIFIPDFMIKQWPERDRLAVIAHELAHVLRHDLLAHHSMRLLRVLFWFLPPIWWMQRELHRAQDTACDECAAVVLGSGVEFGKALTQLADYCLITNPVYPALGILHAKPSLIQRLENIMNTQLKKLTRLSFSFKFALSVVSVCIIMLSGLTKQIVIAQTLDIEYLGNYSGGQEKVTVDGVAYFDPYYVLIGRQNGRIMIAFCTYKDKALKVEHSTYLMEISESSNYKFKKITVSDKYLIFNYSANSQDYFYIYDRNKNWTLYQYGIALSTVNEFQIIDDILYILCWNTVNGKEEDYIFCWNILRHEFIKFYTLPNFVQASCMAILGNEVVLNDRDISIIDTAPTKDRYGYIRGTLTESGQVIVPDARWFVQSGMYAYLPFFMKGSLIYINGQYLDPISPIQISIYDWSNKENPKLIQKFTSIGYFKDDKVYQDLLLLEKQLYRFNGTEYSKIVDLPQFLAPVAISQKLVIGCYDGNLVAYDISDPSQITQVRVPIERSEIFRDIYACGSYLLQLKSSSVEAVSIAILDAAVPTDIKQAGEMIIPGKRDSSIQFHHSLFTVRVKEPTPETIAYAFQKDSPVPAQIVVPPLIQDASIARYGDILYNDKVFIQGYNYAVPNGHQTPDPAYQQLYIYRRDGNQINQTPSSTLELALNDAFVQLTGALLITSNSESITEIVNKQTRWMYYNYINIYSIENPERPVLLTKYRIPQNADGSITSSIPLSIRDLLVEDNTVVYTLYDNAGGFRIGFIDIHDPLQPKQQIVSVTLSSGDFIGSLPNSMAWYKNMLLLKTNNEIIFYRMDTQKNWQEISRIKIGASSGFTTDGNRLYVSKNYDGIDTYQFRLEDTGILIWKQL